MSPSTHRIRIALVNDYEIVLAGIREMLAPYADQLSVVEIGANTDVISDVDIALYDTYGQDEGALESIRQPLNANHVGKLVVYTWNHSPALVQAAEAAGVDGLLSKTLGADDLVQQLLQIANGERILTYPDQSGADLGPQSDSRATWPGREEGLTMREAEMIALISQGLSNAEIAGRTYLSPNSVKSYIRSAYRKIGVQRRSQAVAWGIDHNMGTNHSRQLV